MLEQARDTLRSLFADDIPHPHELLALTDARSNQAFAILDDHGEPVAVLKLTENATKLIPERHALELLDAHPATPRVLAHRPGALLLSWIPGAPLTPVHTLESFGAHAARALGEVLGALHTITPPAHTHIKLLHDPLPLPRRLGKLAHRSVARAKKHLDEEDITRLAQALSLLEVSLESPDMLAELSRKRLVHRDLNPHNLILAPESGDLLGLVDFERAAAAPPAWDFVKLRWWLFDHAPAHLWETFSRAYTTHTPLPPRHLITLFELFEALTMLAYFAHSPLPYADQARRYIDQARRSPP